jgi:hypothetical protein
MIYLPFHHARANPPTQRGIRSVRTCAATTRHLLGRAHLAALIAAKAAI